MNDAQLVKRLEDLGISITIDKLRRYAAQELVAAPPIRYQRQQKRVGKPPNPVKAKKDGRIMQKARLGRLPRGWPEQALEEAAALWAVSHNDRGVRITAERAKIIKDLALRVWTGWPIYRTAPVCKSPEGVPQIDIQPQFASEGITESVGSGVISTFPGRDKEDRVRLLDDLVVKWIATVAKIRYARMQEESARQQGRSFHYERPLEKGAIVVLEFRRRPSGGERYQDGRRVTCIGYVWLRQIILGAESDRDDKIILSENSIGTHVLFERDVDFRAQVSTPATLDNIMESIRGASLDPGMQTRGTLKKRAGARTKRLHYPT